MSTRLVSPSAVSADPPRLNDYDSFAEAYTAETEAGLINAYYNRHAILTLAADVAGRRILDAGCGSGPLMAALRDQGAIVTGFDKSAGMLELARRRRGSCSAGGRGLALNDWRQARQINLRLTQLPRHHARHI
jgi:2-polyprenyl-3-methyl-5-hydroxy-6-metoxy-1,4-benzoquinol methylase